MARRRSNSRPSAASPPPTDGAELAAPTAAEAPPSTPPAPVKRIRIRPPSDADRPRAGGHVLTERGWVPEQRQE